jgi:chaperone modulatory protein CbpM
MDPRARANRPARERPAAGGPGQDRPRADVTVSYALVRPTRLDLESFARATGSHPDLVTRLVTLGLLDAQRDAAGRLCFPPGEVARLARIQRLRASFALNYAALGLVLDLLERLEAAEASLRDMPQRSGGRTWTRPV